MSSSKKTPDLARLFGSALAEGTLSSAGYQALTVVDIGAEIQAGLGVHVDDVAASEVVLVTMMPDDSGSIRFGGNAQAVRDGHNLVLDALRASKAQAGTLVHTRYLNGQVLCPYRPLADAVAMTAANYDPCLGTPLYDQAVVLLGTVLAKTQEFAEHGVPVRSVTLLITDGADVHSTRARAADVAALVNDLRRAENHLVAAMGVSDGTTDFERVFGEMGIPEEWILTPGNSARDIRRAFQVFSQSGTAAGGPAPALTWAAAGGFGGN
jgi:hypothetical protein